MLKRQSICLIHSILIARTIGLFNNNPFRHSHKASSMAWLSSGGTNDELVENMKGGGLISNDVIANVRPFWLIIRLQSIL
jgi:hypothetical protein